MDEPKGISDEEIDVLAKEADKNYDGAAPFSSLRDVRHAFARALLALAAERAAEFVRTYKVVYHRRIDDHSRRRDPPRPRRGRGSVNPWRRLAAALLFVPLGVIAMWIFFGMVRNPELRPAAIIGSAVACAMGGFWLIVSEKARP